jgi:glycosyltransferase involved in cell wall biosynthesis
VKIIVSHPGRQHVHQMLFALQSKKYLSLFFTTLWDIPNSSIKILKRFFPLFRKTIEKRFFLPLDPTLIRLSVYPEFVRLIISKIFRQSSDQAVWIVDRLHDRYVSRKLKSLDYDIFISFENCSYLSFKQAKKANKITILDLAHVHHSKAIEVREKYPYFKSVISSDSFFERMNQMKDQQNNFVDYFIVLSFFAKETLMNAGISQSKIFLCNIGFDPRSFKPKKDYRSEGALRLLFVGRVSKLKGINIILEAIRMITIDVQLEIIGPVGDAGDLLNYLPGNVIHIPYLDHGTLVSHYQNADIVLSPSYLDSWGMVVLESMACGTPVIVSENTGSKEVVEKGGGIVIPVGDAGSLKEKLEYLFQNRREIETLGRRAAELAETYTWQRYHQNLNEIIEQIYNGHTRRQ